MAGKTSRQWQHLTHAGKINQCNNGLIRYKSVKEKADELSTTISKTVLPILTSRMKAQEQLNFINQSVIGAKEGFIKAITKVVGSNVTDTILQTADESKNKSINSFMLFEVMNEAIDGADRTSTNNMLEQLLKVINQTFDF